MDVYALAAQWALWDKNPETKKEIADLVAKKDEAELKARLGSRLAFGTAGLRGAMGAGYSRMNNLVIQQTTQGLLRYLQDTLGKEEVAKRGAVIGFDARYHSSDFGRIAASVFVSEGVPVKLFGRIVPTPFVPYAMTKYNACIGIMVTASHNPKPDNGYKVYWGTGYQIIPPHDSGIATAIEANLAPWDGLDTDLAKSSPLCTDPLEEVATSYYNDAVANVSVSKATNKDSKVQFVYTPIHGVGKEWAERVFAEFGFKPFVPCKEQIMPDPAFPTAPFPNPEEGKGVLAFAMKEAEARGAKFVIANDPDADRFAAAEFRGKGDWYVFSGNELGALFAWWVLEAHKKSAADGGKDLSKVAMLNSTVSSKMLKAMGAVEGFRFEETLTGFKWLGHTATELTKDGYKVLFAYEEAIGFMVGPLVKDKDGVTAMGAFAEMADYLDRTHHGMTPLQKVTELRGKYGTFQSNNGYVIVKDPALVDAIFARIRTGGPNGGYVELPGYKVAGIRDLTTGVDTNYPDKKARLHVDPNSHMITWTFEDGAVATLRTSGTEPKVKFYTEMSAKGEAVAGLKGELQKLVDSIVDNFLEPEKHGIARPKKPE